MGLKETIKKDFVKAFRNKDSERKSVLSMVNSEIKNAEIELKVREEGLSDEQVIEVIKRKVKQNKDAIEKYKTGGREELAEKEQKELDILKEYLPEEMSSEEIEKVVKEILEESGVNDPSQLGKVMGMAMKRFQGLADGNLVREIATKLLQK